MSAFKNALKKKKQGENILESVFDRELSEHSDSSVDSDLDEKLEITKQAAKDKSAKKDLIKKKKLTPKDKEIVAVVEEADGDEEDGLNAFKDPEPNSKEWKNRQRTLVLCSRGVNSRYRHLMNDVIDLLPHSKKEVKIERTVVKGMIDDIAFDRSCNNCIYFESRKKHDLFMWLIKSPDGPSFKFAV